MENKNQQLTVKQQTLLTKIQQAGEVNELVFAQKTIEFDKIKNIPFQDLVVGLAMIFTKVSNLLGIKEPISDINKQDIKEMILSRFPGLSLEEIDYAFKLERYNAYGEKTGHFQLFNAEYVSSILTKYKKWLNEKRVNHNLPLSKEPPKTEMTQEEKNEIVYIGVLDCFSYYQQHKSIEAGKGYVYDYFFERKRLPKHTPEFKAEKLKQAQKEIEAEIKSGGITLQVKEALKAIQPSKVAVKCKEIILREYFEKVVKEKIEIKNEMK